MQSIKEWIRLKGLPTPDQDAVAEQIFSAMLKSGKDHRADIDAFKLPDAGMTSDRWLAVVGVDSVTRVRLKIVKNGRFPEFEFKTSDRDNKWFPARITDPECRLTGDGTVPFEGAVPKFLAPENLVCVTPADYGYWEIGDKVLTEVGGFHGILPKMNMLHRLLVRFFTDAPDKRDNTWGRRAPGVADGQWKPPLALKDKTLG